MHFPFKKCENFCPVLLSTTTCSYKRKQISLTLIIIQCIEIIQYTISDKVQPYTKHSPFHYMLKENFRIHTS